MKSTDGGGGSPPQSAALLWFIVAASGSVDGVQPHTQPAALHRPAAPIGSCQWQATAASFHRSEGHRRLRRAAAWPMSVSNLQTHAALHVNKNGLVWQHMRRGSKVCVCRKRCGCCYWGYMHAQGGQVPGHGPGRVSMHGSEFYISVHATLHAHGIATTGLCINAHTTHSTAHTSTHAGPASPGSAQASKHTVAFATACDPAPARKLPVTSWRQLRSSLGLLLASRQVQGSTARRFCRGQHLWIWCGAYTVTLLGVVEDGYRGHQRGCRPRTPRCA